MTKNTTEIRDDFPILDQRINGNKLVYLDNAATTQTPTEVYDVFKQYYSQYNANIHRGIHTLSHEASIAYEQAHDRLAEFIGASGGREEMVFTKNATESINLVAYGLGLDRLGTGDTIVTTEMEHHASLVTWQQIAKRTGANVRYIRVTDNGCLDMEHAKELIGPDTEIVSVVHASNVLGTINPVNTLAKMAHEHGAYIIVDGSQSVPNRPIDVESMDADFFAFSGHKMAGPTGIGGLYGKRHLLEEMDPFLYGGEMIQNVTLSESTWNELPWKFEAGTPPIAEGIALAGAADYLDDIGMEKIKNHEDELVKYLLKRLHSRDNVTVYGPKPKTRRTGLVSFNIDGVHGHDISSILNDRAIAIRAGNHCTQPLHDKLEIPGSVRASIYIYNTIEEIDKLLDVIENADEKCDELLKSNRFHEEVYEHHINPKNSGGLPNPTTQKAAEETTCGDDGEFHIDVSSNGMVERLAYKSESCAVSQAIASILTVHLSGKHIEEVATESDIVDLLDNNYPPLREDCVLGPEKVIQEAAAEYMEHGG